jgi:hypothetical protein
MWSNENRKQLNPDNCKELRISFTAEPRSFDPILINGKELEVVMSFKLLGLTINNNLTWNHRADDVLSSTWKPITDKEVVFLLQVLPRIY